MKFSSQKLGLVALLVAIVLIPKVALATVDLEVTSTWTNPVNIFLGATVNYSANYKNSGNEDMSDVRIRFTFSQPVTLVNSAFIGGSVVVCTATSASVIECPVGNLDMGLTRTLANLEMRPSAVGDVDCAVSVSVSETDTNPANDSRRAPRAYVFGGTWATTTLLPGAIGPGVNDIRIGENSSLALDPNGNPVIAYQRLVETGPGTGIFIATPSYIRFANGRWSAAERILNVESDDVGERIGLDLDGDIAHFLLLRDLGSPPPLGYLSRDLTTASAPWGGELLEGGNSSDWYSLDVGLGGPQAIYRGDCTGMDLAAGYLVHSFQSGDSWPCLNQTTYEVAGPMAIAISNDGAAHVVFSFLNTGPDPDRAAIRYLRSSTRAADETYSWTGAGTVISSASNFGSVAGLDPGTVAGQVHLSIDSFSSADSGTFMCVYAPTTRRLLVYKKNPSNNTLTYESVDGTSAVYNAATDPSDIGKFCDIALNPATAQIHVSYYDEQNNKLRYATKHATQPATAWVKGDVDAPAGGDVGQYSSMALDADGFAHISYYDAGTGSLKYATNRLGCGNRIVETGELCDDGNTTGGDGCSTTCQTEVCGNTVCDMNETNASCPGDCPIVCGNGTCDAGETNATCPTDCPAICGNGTCETGEDSVTCPADCPTVCGNGSCETGENSTNCSADCGTTCGDGTCQTNENDVTCPADCRSVCGNGTCETGENNTNCSQDCLPSCGNGACDGAETNATCPADCASICGNQVCESGENNQNCSADCAASCGDSTCGTGETNATCPRDCPAVCGNGVVEGTEQCDDRNTTPGDSCSATCQTEGGGGGAVCGNNRKEGDEQCDDGNMNSGDGCSATCRTEEAGPVCGNRVVEAGEECDDGNVTVGDGCNASCKKDSGTGATETETIVPPPGRPTRGGCSLIL